MRYARSTITAGFVVVVCALVGPSAPRATSAREAATGGAPTASAASSPAAGTAQYFDAHVAPLLARHCLECHDASTKKGRLDLSRRDAAMAGGKHGKAVVPGKAAESPLWTSVESGEMPDDRPPLSPEEKRILRAWIDAGAVWSGDAIDPLALTRDGRAAQNWLRRLTVPEYVETVRAAVGVDVGQDARRLLPPDLRADGFSNTAYNLNVDLAHVEAYARLAAIVVDRMDVEAFASRYSKRKEVTDDAMRELVSGMGKALLRGPLAEHEIAAFLGVAKAVAADGGSYAEAVRCVVEAMLQSPRFVYRIERQRGDGTAQPVDRYELASRLSYILWGGPPDDELMRAADAGELADRDRVASQVRRMLADPRAVKRSGQFIADWLNLDRLANLRPNRKRFPKWDERLAADMRAETLAFFEEVAWRQRRPLSDLLNAKVTFATPRLAAHYGLTPARAKGGIARYDLSAVPARGGLLTQGSALTVGGDEASMVARGLFVLKDLLSSTVGKRAAGVDTTPVPTKPGMSQRAIAEGRLAMSSCAGCHSKFEPLAFGLGKFDGIGGYSEKDHHGNPLRDDGEILFPGQDKPVKYKSSAELMDLLAVSERVRMNITRKVTQFALGRPLVESDGPELAKIHDAAQAGGGTYASLITAIVMSDLVQTTRTEATE